MPKTELDNVNWNDVLNRFKTEESRLTFENRWTNLPHQWWERDSFVPKWHGDRISQGFEKSPILICFCNELLLCADAADNNEVFDC